jgi:hypothetical protein
VLKPVILPEPILAQARAWQVECERRWAEVGRFVKVGEAILVSPVDKSERKVVLSLSGEMNVKGKVFPGIRDDDGKVIGEGYAVYLDRQWCSYKLDLPAVLLHEMVHAVDPEFDRDCEKQGARKAKGLALDSLYLYTLPSEQRAFTAMWTEDLRKAIDSGAYTTVADAVNEFKLRNKEFKGFCDYNPGLMPQVRGHIRTIVADLVTR